MSTKLTGRWKLWRGTVAEYKANWKRYLGAVVVVTLPIAVLSLSPKIATDAGFVAYSAVASLIVNLAVLAMAGHRLRDDDITVREAYYDGTANFVRFVVASFGIAACLLPAGLGTIIFVATLQTGTASLGEVVVMALVALILAVPSFWLLVRFVLATVVVANAKPRPWAALGQARQLTMGYFWATGTRLLLLGLWLLLIAVVLFIPIVLLGLVLNHQSNLLYVIYQFAIGLVALPLASIYLTHLYYDLEKVNG